MEINISNNLKLKILLIISWIIFVGVCIDAGSFLVSLIAGIINPDIVHKLWLWQEVDLSALAGQDRGNFLVVTAIMSIVGLIKALMFYLVIKVLHHKELDLARPFNSNFGRFIFNLSYLSLFAGIFSFWGVKYIEWLNSSGVSMPDVRLLRLGGADVWIFMGVVLLVVAQLFKRGIDLQLENDLTV